MLPAFFAGKGEEKRVHKLPVPQAAPRLGAYWSSCLGKSKRALVLT